jgi:ABC-type nitrate/sulfonate/bicarbonate transport system substrate-binding protein
VSAIWPRLARLVIVACLLLPPLHQAVALDSVSMQLKWKHQFQFAGYYQALEQGFYRDAGLDVTIARVVPVSKSSRRLRAARRISASAAPASCANG